MPTRYPQEVALRDGRRLLVRPFTANDTQALWEFFERLPAAVRRFAWDPIDDRATVEGWAAKLDYDRVFPLLAFDGGNVVADATLHYHQNGPLRLVGRIKWLVDPDWRNVGLSTALVSGFITIARESGLHHLSTLLISDIEANAIEVLKNLGFEARELPGYGVDPDGGAHDMTFMFLPLS